MTHSIQVGAKRLVCQKSDHESRYKRKNFTSKIITKYLQTTTNFTI